MNTTIPVVWMDGTMSNGEADFAFALNASCGAGSAEAFGSNAAGQNWANPDDASDVVPMTNFQPA